MFLTTCTFGLLGYIGPGAGLGLLGALIGLFLAVASAVGFIVLWPLRAMFRRRKENQRATAQRNPAEQVIP